MPLRPIAPQTEEVLMNHEKDCHGDITGNVHCCRG